MRILLGPLFLWVYAEYESFSISLETLPYLLLTILGIAEISDICDGYLARKYNQVTDLGKVLDPMADSIYRISLFLTFTLPPVRLPMILIFILLYRDLMISTLRTLCALKGIALAARTSGKLKAIIQGIAAFSITFLLIPYSFGDITENTLHFSCTIIATLTAVYSLLSGVEYVYAYRHIVTKLLFTKQQHTFSPTE